ncbi:deoxyribonuclease-1-like 1 isoform X3 [Syngnathoides biaculeatus]|uniref:deoxyribonuclease-1-like 1 isoform X3 n=1 Tax=Syngnathoides biaculeatus TaxID=300417 RepID=UPI002ADE0F49|nr:deoxyribonuclease-1-like 1 isoform X3 [Syngnathoides biaculeatus]
MSWMCMLRSSHGAMSDLNHEYKAVASERLGRSETYQEQYVFVYRRDRVTVTGQYQYPDNKPGNVDAFSREPFVVRFKAPETAIKEFVLIAQHTSPANVSTELDALYDVMQHVKRMWKTENVMLLGDFNADCSYLSKRSRDKLRLFRDNSLFWLLPEKTDTTVRASTSCAYDRIVVHGDVFSNAVVPFSAKPFDFQTAYQLTEEQVIGSMFQQSHFTCSTSMHFSFAAYPHEGHGECWSLSQLSTGRRQDTP